MVLLKVECKTEKVEERGRINLNKSCEEWFVAERKYEDHAQTDHLYEDHNGMEKTTQRSGRVTCASP